MARKRKLLFAIKIANISDNELINGILNYFHAGNKASAQVKANQLLNTLGNNAQLISINRCSVTKYNEIRFT